MAKGRSPWTTLVSRSIYENRWIALSEREVIAPTGAPGIYGVVHFKNRALGVLAIDEEGRTILVGQERYVSGEYSWELVEGGGPLETPALVGAQRELSEEAGLKAEHWLALFDGIELSNSVTDERGFAFLAWGLSPDLTHLKDATEELSVRRVPYSEALRMAVSGEITDAFSLVMLFKADHLLRTGALPGPLSELMRRG